MRAVLLIALLALAGPAAAQIPSQLPRGVDPVAYDLTLTPDPERLTFEARVEVRFKAAAPTQRIVLNAAGLEIAEARLDGRPAAVSLNAAAETATFSAPRPIARGGHSLSITYRGRILDGPAGFFHIDQGGKRMLATQFEPSDARRLLPVFDEPAKKAVFALTAIVPQGQLALSNMPEAASEPLAGGLRKVRFQPTPPMSSYLLFFGLGDLERLSAEADGVVVSVVMRRGEQEKGRYALQAATQLLHDYDAYFGVKYPLPKLDLVGAPGEVGGSMENWGAILFSDYHLTVDPAADAAADRQLVFNTVAHEMAHQWFGDLVTMAWWDDLWLNEGFANWMATKATVRFHPEWSPQLDALGDKDRAMRTDAQGAAHPIVQPIRSVAQAEQAFDEITYNKGAAIIGMLEAYVGEDAWRSGLQAYLRGHAFGNARSADLWRAMDAAGGKPVSAIARDFTLQSGVPVIRVATDGTLRQAPSGALGGGARAWRTPIRLRSLDPGPTAGLVVDARGPVQAPVAPPLLANAGQAAYARTAYDGAAFEAVLARFGTLGPTDQFAVLMDAYAMGVAGVEPLSQYLRLLGALPAGADPAVWAQPTDTLAELDTGYASGPQRAAFRAWAAGVLRPVRLRLGFDARAGEADNDAVLRRRLLPTLGRLQDAAVLAEARSRFVANGSDPARLDPAERPWVQAVIARAATPGEFEALLAAGKRETDPLRQQRLFADLARVEDPALAERFLEVLLTEAAPAHQAPRLVLGVAAGHPDLAWTFALAHMPQLTPGMDALTRTTFAPAVASASSDLERANELADYAARRIPADAQGEVRTALARIRARADLRARSLPQIDAWIAAR